MIRCPPGLISIANHLDTSENSAQCKSPSYLLIHCWYLKRLLYHKMCQSYDEVSFRDISSRQFAEKEILIPDYGVFVWTHRNNSYVPSFFPFYLLSILVSD